MNITANVNYEATSEDEFLALLDKLLARNITPNVTVKPAAKDEKGPNEREFLQLSGMQRMRLSNEENALVQAGQATREEIAAQKVVVLKASDDGLSVAERQGAQKIEPVKSDDGESFT